MDMLVTLYKRNKEETERFNENATIERYRALKHCPSCNSELYGEWEYYVNETKDIFNKTYLPEHYYLSYGSVDNILLDKTATKKCKISSAIKNYRNEIKIFRLTTFI